MKPSPSRCPIERHGFTIVASEVDWPEAAIIDRYVRHREPRPGEETTRSDSDCPLCGGCHACYSGWAVR